jgi:crossover junction endodeoxyribonuclease RusA
MLTLNLSWPPSVNHYWLTSGKRRYVSFRGIAFRRETLFAMPIDFEILLGRIYVEIEAYPPDKRIRDIDNIIKCVLDSLEFAEVYESDNQVDEIYIVRKEVKKPGSVIINIREI